MQNYLAPGRQLRVDGHLDVEGPRGRLTLAASGQTITLDSDRLSPVFDLLGARSIAPWNLSALRKVHAQLASSGITLEVRQGSRRVGRIGREGRPILAAIRLGIALLFSNLRSGMESGQ